VNRTTNRRVQLWNCYNTANEFGQRRSDSHCHLRKLTFRKSGVPDGYFLTGRAGSRSGG